MADLLFELGVEELPAHSVPNILGQIRDLFQSKLEQNFMAFDRIDASATNRRLMIYINEISEETAIRSETVLGPTKKIALDEKGEPKIPLRKFLEFNQVKLADVVEIETPKGIYMGVVKVIEGKKTEDLIGPLAVEVLGEVNFPKAMVWNDSRVPFLRPIRNILLLFKNQPVDIVFAGVKSSDVVSGHPLLSFDPIKVYSFRDYFEGLQKNFVMIREEERKQKILGEIAEIEEELDANVRIDDEILEYFVYSNEYPVVFSGRFNSKYLTLPPEVIAAFMINEKKLLPVYDRNGNLNPFFVGVSNIPDENRNVSRGNERVIQATFEDAQFFWNTDIKDDFRSLRELLKNVVFQKELGSYYDKSERLVGLVDFMAGETKNFHLRDKLLTAAALCKNDLLTRMVREFPVTQGIMGGLYLRQAGEAETVWKAVYGHYQPKGFGDEKLDDVGAGLLSIADRIDNITGFVSLGIKISSSKDPYGIRRDANAIIKIIIDFELNFDLTPLIRLAAANFAKNDLELGKTCHVLHELFRARIESTFKDNLKFRHDVVQSVLAGQWLSVHEIHLRAIAVSRMVETASIEQLIALHKRVRNIIRDFPTFPFSEELLTEKAEKILFDIFKESKPAIVDMILRSDYLKAGLAILEMKPVIDRFFVDVLIMAKDESIKKNRIALLQRIDELLSKIADFTSIIEINTGE